MCGYSGLGTWHQGGAGRAWGKYLLRLKYSQTKTLDSDGGTVMYLNWFVNNPLVKGRCECICCVPVCNVMMRVGGRGSETSVLINLSEEESCILGFINRFLYHEQSKKRLDIPTLVYKICKYSGLILYLRFKCMRQSVICVYFRNQFPSQDKRTLWLCESSLPPQIYDGRGSLTLPVTTWTRGLLMNDVIVSTPNTAYSFMKLE